AILKPLTVDVQRLIAASAGSTFADRGLVPTAFLSDGGYWLLVSHERHVLAAVEREKLFQLQDPMVTMLFRTRELLSSECGLVDSYNDPMKVQLHLPPCLPPVAWPKYRSPQFFIDHRVIVAGSEQWPVPAKVVDRSAIQRWFAERTTTFHPVSLIDVLPDDARILSFRDHKGGLHLPLDYFLPGINDPLQQALAAQAILAATVTDAESLESVLRRHTADLLRNSELFPPPAHQRLVQESVVDRSAIKRPDRGAISDIRPLLSLYDEFARYLHSSQFVTSRERDGADAGPGLWDERRAHLNELRSRIMQLVPEDAEARDRFIDEWFPEEVAETIRRFSVAGRFPICRPCHCPRCAERFEICSRCGCWLTQMGTGSICAKHPSGRSGKLNLSPFVSAIRWVNCGGCFWNGE
ncbi:MAG: hypothetical protein HYV60_13965, partial [Planctomycetia bacterium]|nr:hypothetical protein [Planctomycetia bacterium]